MMIEVVSIEVAIVYQTRCIQIHYQRPLSRSIKTKYQKPNQNKKSSIHNHTTSHITQNKTTPIQQVQQTQKHHIEAKGSG